MASALKKLNNLEILNLGDCLLKSGGTKLICKALGGRHPNLRELVLDSNEIRLKGGLEIVKAVEDKKKLEKLSIDANQFGASGLKQIMKKLSDIGKSDIVDETEDNEEPDSDEEDPDVSEDEESSDPTPSQPSQSSASIFGGSPKPSIFGGASSTSTSIFGGSANTTPFKPAGNLFTASPSSVFGGSTSTNSASIFAGNSSESPKPSGIFSSSSKEDNSSSKPTFGASVFGNTASGGSSPFLETPPVE